MKNIKIKSILLATILVVASSATALADQLEGLIETRILDFDPQSGVKSQHFFFIDFEKKSVTDSYETGVTEFFGIDLASIRDNFSISEINFKDDIVTFIVKGTTASGVGFIPNIDYKFKLKVNKNGEGSIVGCHDGYPAYLIQFNGKNIYEFKHEPKEVLKLFGSCDIEVNTNTQ